MHDTKKNRILLLIGSSVRGVSSLVLLDTLLRTERTLSLHTKCTVEDTAGRTWKNMETPKNIKNSGEHGACVQSPQWEIQDEFGRTQKTPKNWEELLEQPLGCYTPH